MAVDPAELRRVAVSFVSNSSAAGHTEFVMKMSDIKDGNERTWSAKKRYREFRDLHDALRMRYGESLPMIPGKRLFGSMEPAFIAQRQEGLQKYMNELIKYLASNPDPVSVRTLLQFLGDPHPVGEKKQEKQQYEQILETMHTKLLNLALPPLPLDQMEVDMRVAKYSAAMKAYVLSQPVDPIYTLSPVLHAGLVELCPGNAERLDQILSKPDLSQEADVLDGLLGKLQEALSTSRSIVDESRLIVEFPKLEIAHPPA